jgi:amidase
VDPTVEDKVDAALDAARLIVREVRLPGWDAIHDVYGTIVVGEMWRAHPTLLDAGGVGAYVNGGLHAGRALTPERLAAAMSARVAWRSEVEQALGEVDLLALPTLVAPPPLVTDYASFPVLQLTAPFNVAGVPVIAMPVPSPGFPVPVSLQLAGPLGGEELLCATALMIEQAV